MRVAIGADHEGYLLKDEIIKVLVAEGYDMTDKGTCGPEPVDYPDFAMTVGDAVRTGDADRGILICGSGIGVCVAANKLKGVRAGLCHDVYSAHQSVEHDNINVLCLGPNVVGTKLAIDLVKTWLEAKFTGAERHLRRLHKIDEIEASEDAN